MESANPSWTTNLAVRELPYLEDHCVQGSIVYPAAAYIEMALAAAREITDQVPVVLENVEFKRVLTLDKEEVQQLQFIFDTQGETFGIYSRPREGTGEWTLHSTGRLQPRRSAPDGKPLTLAGLQHRCKKERSRESCYAALKERGLQYGPRFQGLETMWHGDQETLSRIQLPDKVGDLDGYQLHPALLDACFQAFIGTVFVGADEKERSGIYLPVRVGRAVFRQSPQARSLWCYAKLVSRSASSIEGDLLVFNDAGEIIVEISEFRCQFLPGARASGDWSRYLYELRWYPQAITHPGIEDGRATGVSEAGNGGRWLIFADRGGVGQHLAQRLQDRGEASILVFAGTSYAAVGERHFEVRPDSADDITAIVKAGSSGIKGVVHLWSLDAPKPEDSGLPGLELAQRLGCVSTLLLVQTLAKAARPEQPRLWLITRGAQTIASKTDPVMLAQAPLWGLGRVIGNEMSNLRCTLLDLDPGEADTSGTLLDEISAGDDEQEIAWRDGSRYTARLVRPLIPADASTKARRNGKIESYRLEASRPGRLSSLLLREEARRRPGPDEVEIEVYSAGLNFRDVLKALGLYPTETPEELWLGDECAGKIVRLGKNVDDRQVGDEVLAIAAGCLRKFVTVPKTYVFAKPANLSFDEAGTIPIVFMTTHYALNHLARLSRGERILIHAAAGGVGLSALELAQQAGAEIFATAGTPDKREYLKSLGVKHVMDSRSQAFVGEIMEATGGKGVSVVLNSLAGEFIPNGLSVLEPTGRFVELGKIDIYQDSKLGLAHFKKGLSFFAVDLGWLMQNRPEFSSSLLGEVLDMFEAGTLRPLPVKTFPISDAGAAFRHMRQAKQIGKIAVSLHGTPVEVAPAPDSSPLFRSDATYLISGGLSGFGLEIGRWLVDQGARHLVLLGRRGVASPDAEPVLAGMRETGAHIKVAAVDITQEDQVNRLLDDIGKSMPPLRGIFHAAVVFDDGYLTQLDEERFARVMAPKVAGAWNLHAATLDKALDYFVCFSSSNSLTGAPGQGNYSAANAFLDAFAHYRRARRLPALTVNFGPFAEVGFVARRAALARLLAVQGLEGLKSQEAEAALAQLLRGDSCEMGVIRGDLPKLARFYASPATSRRFSHIIRQESPHSTR